MNMPTPNVRFVNDLVLEVEEGRLLLKPPFQRRTVWTPAVKEYFIETVLLGLPFPEIFVVTGALDPTTRKRVDHLVDGQQRVSTLQEYLSGSPDIRYKSIKPYEQLSEEQKRRFLSYPIAVRNLGEVDAATVVNIFNRINSTDYALKATERYNALFTGAYRTYCQNLAEHQFFRKHRTFSAADWKRMGDLTFSLTLVTTLLAGYFRREESLADYLGLYNDEFPEAEVVTKQIEAAFAFVDSCSFPAKCWVWKKTDLFTLLVEVCFLNRTGKVELDPTTTGPRLTRFYTEVNNLYKTAPELATADEGAAESRNVALNVFRYLKAATKASNDKYARVARAEAISPLLIPETDNKPGAKKPK